MAWRNDLGCLGKILQRRWDMGRGVGSRRARRVARRNTHPAPAVSGSRVLTLGYPSPDDGHTAADLFSCHLTGTPLAQRQHGIIFGGDASACWNPGEDDETAFRRRMHARLDDALDDFFRHAPEFGASSRITIPKGLDLKIECAALYLLCSVSRADLVKRLKSTHVAKEAMYNWLQDAMQVLDLRTKLPRHRFSV